ncbi:MAG: hypothetical protein ACO3P5_09920, partial [Steroidobacteraceae bacterium]
RWGRSASISEPAPPEAVLDTTSLTGRGHGVEGVTDPHEMEGYAVVGLLQALVLVSGAPGADWPLRGLGCYLICRG